MKFLQRNKTATAFIIIGFLFVVLGCYGGEVKVVFTKAAAICLECIGIG